MRGVLEDAAALVGWGVVCLCIWLAGLWVIHHTAEANCECGPTPIAFIEVPVPIESGAFDMTCYFTPEENGN